MVVHPSFYEAPGASPASFEPPSPPAAAAPLVDAAHKPLTPALVEAPAAEGGPPDASTAPPTPHTNSAPLAVIFFGGFAPNRVESVTRCVLAKFGQVATRNRHS